MPPSEVRALLLLLGLAVVGQGVRYFATRPGEPPGQVQILGTLSAGSPLAQRDSAQLQARPLRPGELVDLDRAPVTEITRLPRIGPRLAKEIVADRAAHGPFGSLAGLDRVAGVGPGLLKLVAPHVSFSGKGALGSGGPDTRPAGQGVNINTADTTELESLPGIGPAKAAAILQYRETHGPFASVEQLARVPGLGPAAVARLQERIAVTGSR